MAGTNSASLKRSKPNYIYSIIGVAIVLFIMGIMGWLFLNLRTIGDHFKEDIRISVYLKSTDKNTIGKLQAYIAGQPYAKNVEYVNPDSLSNLTAKIGAEFKNDIADIQYPKSLVSSLNERADKLGIIFLVMSIILCVIVIISIDNTIRLAMFSNRFLIKTMQMVGATRSFISRPLVIRALINGLISAGIALVVLFGLIQWTAAQFPQIQTLQGMGNNLVLFFGLIVIGVGISVLSTYRSVVKYLKMKLDELY